MGIKFGYSLFSNADVYSRIIVVDSTRGGKRIPDALSKTVPIWCAVINRAILHKYGNEIRGPWDTSLYTPPAVVSPQEHDQIDNRLDEWAQSLIVSITSCLFD